MIPPRQPGQSTEDTIRIGLAALGDSVTRLRNAQLNVDLAVADRNEIVRQLHVEGISATIIARSAGVTREYVYSLVSKATNRKV